MKNITKTLLACLIIVVCLSCLFLVSCKDNKPKANTVNVTLFDGDEQSKITVDGNENYVLPVPEKAGYSFDGRGKIGRWVIMNKYRTFSCLKKINGNRRTVASGCGGN